MNLKKLLFLILLSISTLFASKDIKIGSGGEKGNYYQVAEDIVDYCKGNIKQKFGYNLINVHTNGSIENLSGLLNKKFSVGFIQEDVYYYYKKKDALNIIDLKIQKLMNLYPEYLTILIPKNWHPTSNNTSIFGKLKNLFDPEKNKKISIKSLKNQVVYAKGGAIVSAQALSYFLGLNLKIKNASNVKNINGPFIFVTGNGDERIKKMLETGKWILLSLNSNELINRTNFYKPGKIVYILNGKTVTANTVAIMSVMYARKYRSKKRREALLYLKKCIKNNIDDLIDEGLSNKWTIISKTNGWGD